MRFSLSSLIGSIALMALISTTAAVAVSRLVPAVPDPRIEMPPRYYCVNGSTLRPGAGGSFLLDTETGAMSRLSPLDGIVIEYAACSPWCDGRHPPEIVGRAAQRIGRGNRSICTEVGLARVSLPGPVIRNHRPTNPIMVGHPCWLPGEPSRILFPAGDGSLYLEQLRRDDEPREATPSRRVTWSCPPPCRGPALLGDPVAPVGAAFGGLILVGVRLCDPLDLSEFGDTAIWWLKLDPRGRSIVAAGRVLDPVDPARERRKPNACLRPDGRFVLAYLEKPKREGDWHMKLAPLSIDPATGAAKGDAAQALDLGDDYGPCTPAFSADGRWVFGVRHRQVGQPLARRSSTAELTPSPEPADRPEGSFVHSPGSGSPSRLRRS